MSVPARRVLLVTHPSRTWLSTPSSPPPGDSTRQVCRSSFQGGRRPRHPRCRGRRGHGLRRGLRRGDRVGRRRQREGSDYTAAILANLLDAEEVSIWKNVPGVLNADPDFFSNTIKLDELSYKEAIELSYSGAKVIHPKTLKPLQNKNIPLFVKSFLEPEKSGTIIHAVEHALELVPVIIMKKNMALITLTPNDFSFISINSVSEVFSLFAKYRLKVGLDSAVGARSFPCL